MKISFNIKELFSIVRRWLCGNNECKCQVGPDFYESFAKAHSDEFEKFTNSLLLSEIRASFNLFNEKFGFKEISSIIRGLNDYEHIFRKANSNVWYVHGKLVYKPYFVDDFDFKYLTLYFYLIALNMDDVEFYPAASVLNAGEFEAESMRHNPSYMDLISDRYTVSSDFKVYIN